MINPRRIAFDVLYKIETDKSYSSILVNQALKENKLSKLDASFASAIIYGVLERKLILDYIIRSYSSVRLKKIEKKTLILLRMAVYQMLFMDKVPESAAVNETVKLAKNLKLLKMFKIFHTYVYKLFYPFHSIKSLYSSYYDVLCSIRTVFIFFKSHKGETFFMEEVTISFKETSFFRK